MTKGHNQGKTNDVDPENKTKGQDRHLTDSQKKKENDKEGRNPDSDPSGGTKGKNSIS